MAESLAASMQELAESFRANAWDLASRLDYTVASAYVVDQFVDDLLAQGDPVSPAGREAMAAYLGEIIRRNVGGEWMQMPDGPHPEDPVLVVRGDAMFPFDKVRNRVALGQSNSVGFFVEALVQSSRPSITDPVKKPSRFGRKGR